MRVYIGECSVHLEDHMRQTIWISIFYCTCRVFRYERLDTNRSKLISEILSIPDWLYTNWTSGTVILYSEQIVLIVMALLSRVVHRSNTGRKIIWFNLEHLSWIPQELPTTMILWIAFLIWSFAPSLLGGSTPRKILKVLASLSSKATGDFCLRTRASNKSLASSKSADHEESDGIGRLDWSRVAIFLVDERYVPVDHADSNQKLIREALLSEGEKWIWIEEIEQ